MAGGRKRKVDFEKAKEEKIILKGLVRMCQDINLGNGNQTSEIHVDCNGYDVLIEKDEVVNFPYAKTLLSLVGEEIIFTVKDVFPNDNIVYGSMKEAYEIKNKPVMDMLLSGQVVEGEVVYLTDFGAYININGVQGLLKNYDFSDDGTEVRQVYKKFSKIKVKFNKYSSNGNILLLPEKKKEGTYDFDYNDLSAGQVILGKVTGVYPDRIYVNILPKVDCMCRVPKSVYDVKINEQVMVRIVKIIKEENKIKVRAEILYRISNKDNN